MAKKTSKIKKVIKILQERRKPLIIPDEMMSAPEQDVLIFIEGTKPFA